MPGIVGIINKKSAQINESTLEMMIGAMRYEDFYSFGKYMNEKMGVYVGWAVHKDSYADCMPIYNETKDVILIFYGENHIDMAVFDNFNNRRHDESIADASYLVHLYEDDEQ